MNLPAAGLLCPKCTSDMRSYERNGVTVDQCTACKGIFLDRGELDRLIDAESSFYDAGATRAAAPPPPSRDDRYRDDSHRSDGYRGDDYRRKKKHSFLSELFD